MSETTTIANAGEQSLAERVSEYVLHHVQDADSWHIGGISIPLFGMTLHQATTVIAALVLIFIFVVKMKKSPQAPSGLTNALESIVVFVRDEISIAYLGEKDGRRMTPIFLTYFFFILALNLIGLIPGFASVTGNFSATAALAVCIFLLMTLGAIAKNGPVAFFKAFVPHGLPLPILLIVTPFEMLGVLIKSFVLALRLFANLLAGHLVLFTLLGMIISFGLASAAAFVPLSLFVFFLEIMVAFLQAYIFTMLSAMFIGQIYHPEH